MVIHTLWFRIFLPWIVLVSNFVVLKGETVGRHIRVHNTPGNISHTNGSSGNPADDACQREDVYQGNYCEYILRECQSDSLINYTHLYYCSHMSRGLLLFFGVLYLLVLFYMLGTVADVYFCPVLSKLSDSLNMSDEVAGLTILALGNGAPDVSSTLAAVMVNNFDIAIGAGLFVTTVVVAAISFVSDAKLGKGAFLRDAIFYLVGVLGIAAVVWDGNVYIFEAVLFLVYYLIYVGTSVSLHYYALRQKNDEKKQGIASESVGFVKVSQMFKNEFDETQEREGLFEAIHHYPREPQYGTSQILIGGDGGKNRSGESNSCIVGVDEMGMGMDMGSTSLLEDDEQEDGIVTVSNVNTNDKGLGYDHGNIYTRTGEMSGSGLSLQKDDDDEDLFETVTGEGPWTPWEWSKEWAAMSSMGKLFFIVTYPFALLLVLSVPDVSRWNRLAAILHPIWSPPLVLLALDLYGVSLFGGEGSDVGGMERGGVPLWIVVLMLSIVASILILLTTEWYKEPRYHPIFVVWGFIVSIIWIYLLANELVGLLQSYGFVLSIPSVVLGATVLAWGNSLGDLDFMSNLVMANNGAPRMAIAASFGGPCFNLLFGMGLALTYKSIVIFPASYPVEGTHTYYVTLIFLLISLISSLVVIPYFGYHIPSKYGFYLLGCYVVYSILVILVVTKIIWA